MILRVRTDRKVMSSRYFIQFFVRHDDVETKKFGACRTEFYFTKLKCATLTFLLVMGEEGEGGRGVGVGNEW